MRARMRGEVPPWQPTVFECPAGHERGTRLFTYDGVTAELVEYGEVGDLFVHPFPGGMLARLPAVTPDDDEALLWALVKGAPAAIKAGDPLVLGDVATIVAYCCHVRSAAALELGLARPAVNASLRDAPEGWLTIATMPTLRFPTERRSR